MPACGVTPGPRTSPQAMVCYPLTQLEVWAGAAQLCDLLCHQAVGTQRICFALVCRQAGRQAGRR
jgi:hypothetical protein